MIGNVIKIEAVELRMWRAPFPQYSDAIYIQWRAYRQGSFRRIVEGYRPYFTVVPSFASVGTIERTRHGEDSIIALTGTASGLPPDAVRANLHSGGIETSGGLA